MSKNKKIQDNINTKIKVTKKNFYTKNIILKNKQKNLYVFLKYYQNYKRVWQLKKKMYKLKKKIKKKIKIRIIHGILNISSSLNNVILTYSTLSGRPLFWLSCGCLPNIQKGQRSNFFVILDTLKKFLLFLKTKKVKKIYVKFKGTGLIRKTFLRSLQGLKFKIYKIYDITPKPHNGCKSRKYKRV